MPRRRTEPRARASGAGPSARANGSNERAEALAPAARALWITLAVLAIARAVLAFTPSMWLWGLNTMRFVSPVAGWILWVLAAASLVPAFSRRIAPALTRVGNQLMRRPGSLGILCAAAAAVLVWLMPDRVHFVGDFLLRQGTVETHGRPDELFPHALPADLMLHYRLPLALVSTGWLDANEAARTTDAIDAAALAWFAVAFASALELEGAAAIAAAASVFFGGYLGLFTGYGKALTELCVLITAAAVFGIRALQRNRALLPLGITLALGVVLHRSALGWLPAAALVWWVSARRTGVATFMKQPAAIAGIAIPLATIALLLPRDAAHFLHSDLPVHLEAASDRAANLGVRIIDPLNLALLLSPIALTIPAALFALKARARDLGFAYLAVLALPFIGLLVSVEPRQGVFRDWDVFASSGVALSLLVAWLVGTTLRAAPRSAWLAVAVTLSVIAPTAQWLLHQTDVERGLDRVHAFALEPPPRSVRDRLGAWDFLGLRGLRLGLFHEADIALARAAEIAPTPRILLEWGAAAVRAEDWDGAALAYRKLVVANPEDPENWRSLALVAVRRNDVPEARRAAAKLLEMKPGDEMARRILTTAPPPQ